MHRPFWLGRFCLGLAIVASSVSGGTGAKAQQPPPSPLVGPEEADELADEEAKQHFTLGAALYDAGRFEEAAREFEDAYRLSKRPKLLYNIYVAQRDASNLTAAISALRAYLEQVPDAPDRVNLKARLRSMEEAKKRQDEQRAAADAARAAEQAQEPSARVETVRSSVPFYIMGGGGALLLASGVTGALALSKAKDLDDRCGPDKKCPEAEAGRVDTMLGLARATDALWITGAVVGGAGLVLWLTGALDRERRVPVAGFGCSGDGCGLSLRGRF